MKGYGRYIAFSHFQIKTLMLLHDDGTLTQQDKMLLSYQFKGIEIINRDEADKVMDQFFYKNNLKNCKYFRDNSIFGLKIFDEILFSKQQNFIHIDSDILFFNNTKELLEDGYKNLYSEDITSAYCLDTDLMTEMICAKRIEQICAGLLRVDKHCIDFNRIEKYLSVPEFYENGGKVKYLGEMTLWCLELSRYKNDTRSLSKDYKLCINKLPTITVEKAVSGHYCGNVYWKSFFYTLGVPYLYKTFTKNK